MLLAFIFDSIGFGEWFVLLAVVLIVVGPRRLPATARNLGKWYNKIRRVADEFKRQLMEMDTGDGQTLGDAVNEVRQTIESEADELKKATDDVGDAFKVEGDESGAEPNSEYGVDEDGVYRGYYDGYDGAGMDEGEEADPAADAESAPAAAKADGDAEDAGALNPSEIVRPAESPKTARRDLNAIKIVVNELPRNGN